MGGECVSVVVFRGFLFVCTRDSIYVFQGSGPSYNIILFKTVCMGGLR